MTTGDIHREFDGNSPVEHLDTKSKHKDLQDAVALCLSGGGFRAMIFHVGALWRLNEFGMLPKLNRISSVSGGSITAAVLGMNWNKLSFNTSGVAEAFEEYVTIPIRGLADKSLDVKAIFTGILTPASTSDKLIEAYDKYLFKGKTLQDLPDDPPRFVINATNVQSGALWRFMKPYMRDWRVGEVRKPSIPLAFAVAASSAFPPVLSPAGMELDPSSYTEGSGEDLQKKPYTTDVCLCDGGVYDNLGLETAWKRYKTVLVSDGGGEMQPDPDARHDWIGHSLRVFRIVNNQVRCLRKRQLISSYKLGDRHGAYWGIRANIAKFNLADVLDCPQTKTLQLANIKTRLKRMDSNQKDKLINWGYAICDAAIRRYVNADLPAPRTFPYPETGV